MHGVSEEEVEEEMLGRDEEGKRGRETRRMGLGKNKEI